ncbi:O-antigen ligase family protein [Mycoplasmatota bacterium WC44]
MMFYKNKYLLKKIIALLLVFFMFSFLGTLFTNLNLLRYSLIVNSNRLIGLNLILFSSLLIIKDITNVKVKKRLFLKYIIHILLVVVAILGIISVLSADSSYFAFYGVNDNYFGINYNDGYLTLLAYFGFFMGAFSLEKSTQKKIVIICSSFSYLVVLIGLCSTLLHKMIPISDLINIKRSLFFNSNHYGYFLTIALLLSMYNLIKDNKLRIFHLIGFTLLSASLIYSNSRGALLSISITMITYIVFININKKFKNRFSYIPILVLVLTTILVNVIDENISTTGRYQSVIDDAENIISNPDGSDTSGSGRWKLWKDGFILFTQEPLIGQGINGVYYTVESDDSYFIRVHNEYLEYALTYGLFVLVLYLFVIGIIGMEFLTNLHDKSFFDFMLALAIFAYLLSAIFGNTKPYTTPYFFMCLGFLNSSSSLNKNINIYDEGEKNEVH